MISVSVECPIQNNLENYLQNNLQNTNHIEEVDYVNEDINCGNSVESVSPRIIHPTNRIMNLNAEIIHSPNHGPRDVLCPELEMSPISITSSLSLSRSIDGSVGDCSICYKLLPTRSNHIFTVCGHLFCVKCIFNWNNQSATCPLCRKPLYDDIISFNELDNFVIDVNNEQIDGSIEHISSHSMTNTSDLIQWTDDPYDGDLLINDISERESIQLYDFRILSLDIFRFKIYIDNLFSNTNFTGQFTYSFIPRNHYIYLNVGSEHLYEFGIRKNTLDDYIDEINFLGHIVEFNVRYNENDDDDDEEDYLIISVLHPKYINDGLTYDLETNSINYITMIFKFASVRRIYSISPVHEQ